MTNFQAETAIIDNTNIGKNTMVWHYTNLYGCKIGDNCTIGSFTEIQNDVIIGDNAGVGIDALNGITTGDDNTALGFSASKFITTGSQNVTIGRQINEEDVFYTIQTPSEAKQLLKKFAHKLTSEELEILNEIVKIQREINPVYGY